MPNGFHFELVEAGSFFEGHLRRAGTVLVMLMVAVAFGTNVGGGACCSVAEAVAKRRSPSSYCGNSCST